MIKTATSSHKPANGANKAPKDSKKKAKPSITKLGQLEALLRRPEGATIAQIVKALDWQPHSARGAMSGALKKKQGLKITSTKAEGQERVYRIVG